MNVINQLIIGVHLGLHIFSWQVSASGAEVGSPTSSP